MTDNQAEEKLNQYVDRILQQENSPIVKHLIDIESQYATKRKNVSSNEDLKQLVIGSILKIDKSALEQMVEDPTIMFAYWKKTISDKCTACDLPPEVYVPGVEFSSISLLLAYATTELDGKERENFLRDFLGASIRADHPGCHLYADTLQAITMKLISPRGDYEGICQGSHAFVNHYTAWQKAWERAQKFKDQHLSLLMMIYGLEKNDKQGSRYSEAANMGCFYHITRNAFSPFFSAYPPQRARPDLGLREIPKRPMIPLHATGSVPQAIRSVLARLNVLGIGESEYTLNFVKDGVIEFRYKAK